MLRRALKVLPAALLLVGVACGQPSDRPADGRDSVPTLAADSNAAPVAGVGDEHAADGHAASGHAAAGEGGLALLPIMQGLGSNMTTLTYALMMDDHETVTTQAAAIAEHAPISAAELEVYTPGLAASAIPHDRKKSRHLAASLNKRRMWSQPSRPS